MSKKTIIAGNWKMNKTPTQGREFIHEIENMFFDIQNTEVIFFPAYPGLFDLTLRSPFYLGAQNCHCLLYTSPSPRDGLLSRMPSSA